jgi:hypothetical protein
LALFPLAINHQRAPSLSRTQDKDTAMATSRRSWCFLGVVGLAVSGLAAAQYVEVAEGVIEAIGYAEELYTALNKKDGADYSGQFEQVNAKLDALLASQATVIASLATIEQGISDMPALTNIQALEESVRAHHATYQQSFSLASHSMDPHAAKDRGNETQLLVNGLFDYGESTYPSVVSGAYLWKAFMVRAGMSKNDIHSVMHAFSQRISAWIALTPATYPAPGWNNNLPTVPAVIAALSKQYDDVVTQCRSEPVKVTVGGPYKHEHKGAIHHGPDGIYYDSVIDYTADVATIVGDCAHIEADAFASSAASSVAVPGGCGLSGACTAVNAPPNATDVLPKYHNLAAHAKSILANKSAMQAQADYLAKVVADWQ